MRIRFTPLIAISVLAIACVAAPAAPSASPGTTLSTGTAPTAAPPTTTGTASFAPTPTSDNVGDVRLHGTFTGHQTDPASESDATFDLIVIWHRPNDIHDMLNFQFESGSFTFSTDVTGVCGGSRSEGGALTLFEDAQFLYHGDLQDHSQVAHASLIDERLNQGGLKFALTTHFDIPSSAAGCEPPYQSYGYISVCALEFRLMTLDTLEPDASCTESGTTWTGHLVEM